MIKKLTEFLETITMVDVTVFIAMITIVGMGSILGIILNQIIKGFIG
jgi:hypothetical protein